MKLTTIGTFGFIKFPNVRVLLFPEDKPLDPTFKTGFKTIYPILKQIQPSNNGVTKGVSTEWYKTKGSFNKMLYDSLMEIKYKQ